MGLYSGGIFLGVKMKFRDAWDYFRDFTSIKVGIIDQCVKGGVKVHLSRKVRFEEAVVERCSVKASFFKIS